MDLYNLQNIKIISQIIGFVNRKKKFYFENKIEWYT